METFIVLGFCFILYEALDFFQSCYTNNNLHEQQHPQFSKDISSGQTNTATITEEPLASTVAALASKAKANHKIVSSTFNASITTIPLSDTKIDGFGVQNNSDLDLIAVSSTRLNCVDSEFGAGVGENNNENDDDHEINDENDESNSDESSDSDIKTIQTNQSSSHCTSNSGSSSHRIYSICDRVNHFNRRSEMLIDYHCSAAQQQQQLQ